MTIDVAVGVRTSGVLAAFEDADDHLDLLVVGGDQVSSLQDRGDGQIDFAIANGGVEYTTVFLSRI